MSSRSYVRARVPALVFGVLGCASSSQAPPSINDSTPRTVLTSETGQITQTTDVSSARQVKVLAPAGAVMTALAQVYSELNIPIGTLQTGSGRIGNLSYRMPSNSLGGRALSTFLDCGQSSAFGNRADQNAVTISIISTVAAVGDTASVVTTELGGQARSFGASTDAIHCQSTGRLEGRINVRVATLMAPRGH